MSVVITLSVPGDTERFRAFVASEPDRLRDIAEAAKGVGCVHHRFGVGDGHVLVVDEWESAEQFQRFFEGNEEIAAVMQAAGAQGAPEITVYDAIETPDQF